MAPVAAVLTAVGRALRRGQKSVWSVAGNNFFLVSAVVMQDAGVFIYLLIGVVILFPLSADPLLKIPAPRLKLLPLTGRELWILRAASPWVNPVTWAIAALGIWAARGKVTAGLWGLAAGMVAAALALSAFGVAPGYGLWRHVPGFPGRLNQLVRKNLRQMLSTLDLCCAVLLAAAAAAFRLTMPALPPDAILILTVLVVLALSSYAGALFGLDGAGGRSRYRLLPVPGWQLLAAKDAAFLAIVVPLTLPLAPLAGLSAALVALAASRNRAVNLPREQVRWRFSTGAGNLEDAMGGLAQAGVMIMAAASVYFVSPLFLAPCIAAWAGSLWWFGRTLDRAFRAEEAQEEVGRFRRPMPRGAEARV